MCNSVVFFSAVLLPVSGQVQVGVKGDTTLETIDTYSSAHRTETPISLFPFYIHVIFFHWLPERVVCARYCLRLGNGFNFLGRTIHFLLIRRIDFVSRLKKNNVSFRVVFP